MEFLVEFEVEVPAGTLTRRFGEQACYRAMDWLNDARASLEAGVFDKVATLLNLEAGLLFFDTISTYFELGEPDEPVARDGKGHRLPDGRQEGEKAEKSGFRTHGKSKDSHDDLPQIVIGMAVTRDGIPVLVLARQRQRPGGDPPGQG